MAAREHGARQGKRKPSRSVIVADGVDIRQCVCDEEGRNRHSSGREGVTVRLSPTLLMLHACESQYACRVEAHLEDDDWCMCPR